MNMEPCMNDLFRPYRRAPSASIWSFAAIVVGVAVRTLAATAMAVPITGPPRFPNATDYSSARDWFLKAEAIVPHGRNSFFFPLVPGHKHILERPDHPDGHFRRETAVLDQTEPFDVPGIGKFETAIARKRSSSTKNWSNVRSFGSPSTGRPTAFTHSAR